MGRRLYLGPVKICTHGKGGVGHVILRWPEYEYCFLLTENWMTGGRYIPVLGLHCLKVLKVLSITGVNTLAAASSQWNCADNTFV